MDCNTNKMKITGSDKWTKFIDFASYIVENFNVKLSVYESSARDLDVAHRIRALRP